MKQITNFKYKGVVLVNDKGLEKEISFSDKNLPPTNNKYTAIKVQCHYTLLAPSSS